MHNALKLHMSTYPARQAIAAHHHDETWFCFVVAGDYRETIHAREQAHGAGHLLVCPPATAHSQRIGAGGARKLLFSPAPSTLDYLREHGVALDSAPHMHTTQIAQLGQRLVRELRNDDPFSDVAREGMALELVAAFGRDAAARPPQAPPWLRLAREFIHDACVDPAGVAAIAAQVGRHPVHLAREFRRHYGQTIGAYQRELRVAKAAHLLGHGTLALTEVALSCGFASHAHFCKTFKAAHGVTPSAYRDSRAA